MPTNEDPLVTFPLRLYLKRVFVGEMFEKMTITNEEAIVLSNKDKDEVYCHVEYPNAENGLHAPRLWTKRGWVESYTKWIKDKARSAEQRRVANIFSENRARVVAELCAISGLDEESLKGIAARIVTNNPKMARKLGITIEEA